MQSLNYIHCYSDLLLLLQNEPESLYTKVVQLFQTFLQYSLKKTSFFSLYFAVKNIHSRLGLEEFWATTLLISFLFAVSWVKIKISSYFAGIEIGLQGLNFHKIERKHLKKLHKTVRKESDPFENGLRVVNGFLFDQYRLKEYIFRKEITWKSIYRFCD